MNADRPSPVRLVVMVGIPGSGKTTYARANLGHALRVSLDDLRLMITGRAMYRPLEPAVVAGGHALLAALLARARAWRRDVLLDATNATRSTRRQYVRMARDHGITAVAVFMDCPLERAIARDRSREGSVGAEVVRRFHQRLQLPSQSEGFAEVIVVKT